jgi:hypothetical protein
LLFHLGPLLGLGVKEPDIAPKVSSSIVASSRRWLALTEESEQSAIRQDVETRDGSRSGSAGFGGARVFFSSETISFSKCDRCPFSSLDAWFSSKSEAVNDTPDFGLAVETPETPDTIEVSIISDRTAPSRITRSVGEPGPYSRSDIE